MFLAASLVTHLVGLAFSVEPPPSSHRDLFNVDPFAGTLATVFLGSALSEFESEELSSESFLICDLFDVEPFGSGLATVLLGAVSSDSESQEESSSSLRELSEVESLEDTSATVEAFLGFLETRLSSSVSSDSESSELLLELSFSPRLGFAIAAGCLDFRAPIARTKIART
jgi:hypothetical protein